MNPTDKTTTGTTSYPTHKTISLVEEKAIVNREMPPAPPVREVKKEVVAETKPETVVSAKNTYPEHKTFSISTDPPALKSAQNQSVATKNPQQEPTKEIKTIIEEKKAETATPVKNTYPSHKTYSLTKEQTVITEIKKEITEAASKINNPENIIAGLKDSSIEKAGNFIKEQPVIQKIDSVIPSVNNPLGDKSLKDTVVEKAGDFIKEQPVVQQIDSVIPGINNPFSSDQGLKDTVIEKAGNFIKEQPAVQKIETAIANANPFTSNQQNPTSYPAHKSVNLETAKQETPVVKEEQKSTVREEPAIVAEKRTEPVVSTQTTTANASYPSHKTHFFVKEEQASTLNQEVKPESSSVTPDSNEQVSAPTRSAEIKKSPSVVPVVATSGSKKPVLWIAASGVLLLASVATAWYTYQQKKTMQEEISALKQNNEALAENVKKLQKDLYIDDIIARAGILDAKNNITVMENASATEVLRACFSVIPNAQSKKGKKTVYIRFIDAAGNVLLQGKENVFEYKGGKIPFSAMQQIDYKGAEMMLCVDFKPTDKLQKGTYKAELYNDGVLDGTANFELK